VSTLDNLRKEAKRWLKALRNGDPSARQRLRLAHPSAPADSGLREIQHALARERGHAHWRALKAAALERDTAAAAAATPERSAHDARVSDFLQFACWDHHVHGRGDYGDAEASAMRLLTRHPELATATLYTAIVCGELETAQQIITAAPQLAVEKGGPRGWEPLLYLCYARLPIAALRDRSLEMAAALLDRGANPNAYYMAGDAVYSALTGVAGEGEQDALPHPRRDDLYSLLLERGADPFDIQVLYNTHFRGDVLWWLERTHAHTMKTGRAADWAVPDWPMFDMGGYGSGARFLLWIAIEKNNVALARWVLEHGANPDPAPARDPRFSKRSVYEDSVVAGCPEIAALLVRHGAPVTELALNDEEAFVAACFRLDRAAVAAALAAHPDHLRSPKALFAAARRDRVDVVELLLDAGVPIEVEDEHHQRALHIAAGNDARRVATLLIERGAEIDPRESRYGGTPMGHASHHDHVAMIDLIAPHSRHVWTLTHRGKIDRLREVLQEDDAPAREVTSDGTTPLFWLPGTDAEAVEIVELLLAHGADPTRVSARGSTAAAVARRRGLDHAAERLDRATGAPAAPDADRDPGPGLEHYDALARDLAVAYDTGAAAALARLRAHYGYAFTRDDIRANVWRRVRTVREAKGAASAFQQEEARQIVARDAGFSSWEQFAASMTSGAGTPPPYTIDVEQRTLRLKRRLADRDWDTVVAVMKEHRLTGLDANGLMTDEMMARIAGVDHLTRLELGGSRQLTDAGLQHLRRMPQLQHLDLSEYPGGLMTDRGLEPLTDLKELRVFRMCWQRGITDRGMAHLAACPHLEEVNVMGTATGDGTVAALVGKPQLTRVNTGRLVTDAGVPLLRQFPGFTAPRAGTGTSSLMSFDDGATRLLLDGPITDRGLTALSGLDGLQGLVLFWHVSALTPDGLGVLADLPDLRALGCDGNLCTDTAMRHFAAIPRLRKLNAQGTVAGDDGFVALSRSQTLEHLWGRECPNLTGRGFSALSQMPSLRGLAVSCKLVDDASLAALPRFPALRELLPIDVSDDGFRHVGACVDLEYLCCMYCRETTDAATAHVVGLPALERYYAGATQITDRSLEMLSTIATLERIELYECLHVTDAGLSFLAALPNLRELALSGLPGVTAEGVRALPARVRVDHNA
jgi:ankyrin repeat protein